MVRFDAVIFDMDGLLLDTERIALETFTQACRQFDLADHLDVFYRCIGTNQASGTRVIAEGLRGRVDPDAFGRAWQINYAEATSGTAVPIKPGAEDLLSRLRALGIPAAVATSTRSAEAATKLEGAGIGHYFRAVVGGEQVERSKPHPDIYLRAAGELGVSPGACLALEDSENGVRAAVSAGMTVVQVPDLVMPSPELMQLGHRVLDSLMDVRRQLFDCA